MTGFESFVGVNPWTALFTFCNMLITFAVLKKFLFKPVKKMIDDRQQEIDTMYADADAAKQKAADLEKEYADHLQSIKDERDAMLREATARAQKREEEIVGEARAEAASIRAAAEADIAQERKKAVNDLKNEIGGMAVGIQRNQSTILTDKRFPWQYGSAIPVRHNIADSLPIKIYFRHDSTPVAK